MVMVSHLRMIIDTPHTMFEYLRIMITDVTLNKHELTSKAIVKEENVSDSMEAKMAPNNTILEWISH